MNTRNLCWHIEAARQYTSLESRAYQLMTKLLCELYDEMHEEQRIKHEAGSYRDSIQGGFVSGGFMPTTNGIFMRREDANTLRARVSQLEAQVDKLTKMMGHEVLPRVNQLVENNNKLTERVLKLEQSMALGRLRLASLTFSVKELEKRP